MIRRIPRLAPPDLVFSPFGSTALLGADAPFVAVVYDLQHDVFPRFFPPALVEQRRADVVEIAEEAAGVACISEYVRGRFLEATGASPSKVRTIPISLPSRLIPPQPGQAEAALSHHGLERGGYLLYPANFWPHKNHALLLRAFASLPADVAGRLKLVLTGQDTGGAAEVDRLVNSLCLAGRVVRTGFVADEEFAALLYAARALVFPSLYEGFGMPVVEAFAAGVPVACSAVASLPEVAG